MTIPIPERSVIVNKHETMTEVIRVADETGYGGSFKVENGKLCSLESGKAYSPDDVTVVDHHRFEGESSGGDMSIVYLIECSDGAKGSVVDAFGTYSDPDIAKFFKNVSIEET